MGIREQILEKIDTEYSYRLAKRMETFRSNEVLGYRTAGSEAEFQTGEMLLEEMKRIGLSHVEKDRITVDGWEFKKAALTFMSEDGAERTIQLGAYQTTLVTDGQEECALMYLGKGTEQDYAGKDVSGKLVLVDINQRDEWWINYPVYQAHLEGAKALIAVQCGGYGEIGDEALNAQDIAGPEDAPAFSISRKDAAELKRLLEGRDEILVRLEADTRVARNCTTYNIRGCIPGKHPDRMVLLSAHYDSYFSGFQDDNTAVAMMLGIGKALIDSGFQPNNTILFCAMAAEEWGVADSWFDWSAGAYEQVFTAHPEWVGKVIADLNFELPALAHGTRARIRSCHEYTEYLTEFLSGLPDLTHAYPEEARAAAPIETWSDDFSISIAGIPAMVNDFTGGSFMETHYHSQFDNDDYYDEKVYWLHHEMFALLVEALDRTAVVPLNFSPVMAKAAGIAGEGIRLTASWERRLAAEKLPAENAGETEKRKQEEKPDGTGITNGKENAGREKMLNEAEQEIRRLKECLLKLKQQLLSAQERQEEAYIRLQEENSRYDGLLAGGRLEEAEALFLSLREKEADCLKRFKAEQDALVRIDWYGNVLYPHELQIQKLDLLTGAALDLEEGRLSQALKKLYQVDNNAYAFMFSSEVYRHFTDYVLKQPKERLKWGYQRLLEHADLYELVRSLLQKKEKGGGQYREETDMLWEICGRERRRAADIVEELGRRIIESF